MAAFFITITNVGRRPILIKSWLFHFNKRAGKREWGFILAAGLPKMLREGEFCTAPVLG
jgi:hypothetical protein